MNICIWSVFFQIFKNLMKKNTYLLFILNDRIDFVFSNIYFNFIDWNNNTSRGHYFLISKLAVIENLFYF
jgi:hypothetical protein